MTKIPPEYYQYLEVEIEGILADINKIISDKETTEVRHFTKAGEYGLALETLCGIINEEEYTIPKNTSQRILGLAQRMNIDKKLYEKIK